MSYIFSDASDLSPDEIKKLLNKPIPENYDWYTNYEIDFDNLNSESVPRTI